MKQEHLKEHIVTYDKGANFDTDKELSCAASGTGEYIDARNARPTSNDGKAESINKIFGEVVKYSNTSTLNGYTCIGKAACNGNLIEIYAPPVVGQDGVIRINGIIVLKSNKFDMRVDYPLQTDVNESFTTGEVFITDNRVPPYIFNVQDLIDSVTTAPNKYFSGFNPLLYQVNLQSPLDTMAFIDLVNVGGGGGLPVGQYQYQMRYTSAQGDRTNWSHPTPMIPVMQSLSSESKQYPWIKTYGGPPAPQSLTALAPRLRFRVTNIYNYDYIEIKRIAYNQGAGIDFTPNGVVVAKIDVTPGEISVKEYIDPQESNTDIALSATDETQELVEVERAKSLRYFDRRLVLMNVKLASKDSALTFKDINGKTGFPVIDKLYKAGHKDPWNHVYKRAYMHGERYGFGIGLYDGVGTKGFATKITGLTNYQIPNRRDTIASETQDYSYDSTVRCADTSVTNVSRTHEVFDHFDSTYKTNYCDFKNVIQKGRIIGATGTKLVSPYGVTQDCSETDAEIENHGADVTGGAVSVSYQPFTPVRQNDPDVSGHNYIVNTKVSKGNVKVGPVVVETGDVHDYRPECFGVDYYSQGMMIAGVDNFPKWAKAFSVVRTKAAKRVLCQGLAYYSLTKGKFKIFGNESLGGKETNKFWYFAPDIENGIVSSDTVNDLIANPQNYKLQFVSPLGFFSEWYSGEDNFAASQRDRIIDMISYVRMLRDKDSDPNNQINPFEDGNMGISGADGYNYIRYDKFRNTGQSPQTFENDFNKGNRVFDIAQIQRVADGRGTYLSIETYDNIYGVNATGGNSDSQFEDQGLKNWTEPLYIVNIIREGAQINDQNIQKYITTSHYQKLESIIGKSTGKADQRFILVDERWEDSIPAPTSGTFGANTDRYIYIRHEDGSEEKWINVTYKTTSQVFTIISDIASNGFYGPNVTGVYRHNNIDGQSRFFEIVFDQPGFYPKINDLIVIKYDNTAPIRVFGGDTYLGETIFAPIDKQANAKDKSAETNFCFGIGLPYKDFKINPRYYTIRKAGAAVNEIQDAEWFTLGYIRQLCLMFTVESRIACHLAYNQQTPPNQFFPLINYVIRPNRWDEDKGIVDNHLYQDYQDDYGDIEKNMWKWGGFRFLQQVNPDYSVEPRVAFFSKPEYGFVEKTEFPTRVMWSLSRPINIQDTPGLKSFPANNSYDIDDDQGEIKYAYDSTTQRGENIYAITNKGICFLATRKTILSDLGGGDIGYMATDSFVKQQMWLSKDVGMFDEWWRSAAEGFVPVPIGDESAIRQEALFFANNESVFMFSDNSVKDIGRIKYYSRVYTDGIAKIGPKYTDAVAAVYDKTYQEYWLQLGGEVNDMFVFGKENMMWLGNFDFKFEKMVVVGLDTYGIRNMTSYLLHEGYVINGQSINFEVLAGAAPEQKNDKEFVRTRINSLNGVRPTKVEFYNEIGGPVLCSQDPTNGPLYLKDYRGYEQFISRIDASVDPKRGRVQGRLLLFKIIHNLASEFKVIDATILFKTLK